jgi:hypothetical protein
LHAEKNKNDLDSENRARNQKEIREKKNNAAPHALVALVEEKQSADPEKEF